MYHGGHLISVLVMPLETVHFWGWDSGKAEPNDATPKNQTSSNS